MRLFLIILVAAGVAAIAISIVRLTDTRAVFIEAIVAGSLVIIFLGLFRFLGRMRD